MQTIKHFCVYFEESGSIRDDIPVDRVINWNGSNYPVVGKQMKIRDGNGGDNVIVGRQLGTNSFHHYKVRFEDDDSVATLKRADVFSYKECVMRFFNAPHEVRNSR